MATVGKRRTAAKKTSFRADLDRYCANKRRRRLLPPAAASSLDRATRPPKNEEGVPPAVRLLALADLLLTVYALQVLLRFLQDLIDGLVLERGLLEGLDDVLLGLAVLGTVRAAVHSFEDVVDVDLADGVVELVALLVGFERRNDPVGDLVLGYRLLASCEELGELPGGILIRSLRRYPDLVDVGQRLGLSVGADRNSRHGKFVVEGVALKIGVKAAQYAHQVRSVELEDDLIFGHQFPLFFYLLTYRGVAFIYRVPQPLQGVAYLRSIEVHLTAIERPGVESVEPGPELHQGVVDLGGVDADRVSTLGQLRLELGHLFVQLFHGLWWLLGIEPGLLHEILVVPERMRRQRQRRGVELPLVFTCLQGTLIVVVEVAFTSYLSQVDEATLRPEFLGPRDRELHNIRRVSTGGHGDQLLAHLVKRDRDAFDLHVRILLLEGLDGLADGFAGGLFRSDPVCVPERDLPTLRLLRPAATAYPQDVCAGERAPTYP